MCKNTKRASICRTSGILLLIMVTLITCTPSPSPHPAASSALPSPESSYSTAPQSPLPLPTAAPDWATVVGRLVKAVDQRPIAGVVAFLERTTPEHTVPPVLYAPPNNQPRATTNEQGYFVISHVPPGEYVVVLFQPPFALQVITHSDGETPMVLVTELGEVIDIGTVRVTEFQLAN